MTIVKIERRGGFIVRYTVSGHSGYAEEGSDIVCAAVSAIAQTAVLGLRAMNVETEVKRKSGYLSVIVTVPEKEEIFLKAQAVLDTMVLGLRDITEGYSAFIRLEE